MRSFRLLSAAPSRLISKRPRVFLHRAVGDPGLNADSVPTAAPVKRGAQLLALPGAKRRPSQVPSPGASAFKPSLGALADLLALELGERRENREEDIADQLVIRRQMRLAVAVEADKLGVQFSRTQLSRRRRSLSGDGRDHPIGSKPLQVDHGRSHAIAREPVECPDEYYVEFASRGIGEQPAELLSLVGTLGTALVVDIFAHHHVPHPVAPCPKLRELVLGVLALVVGRDPRVDRDAVCRSYSHETIPSWSACVFYPACLISMS
jgi:hypothetical protein